MLKSPLTFNEYIGAIPLPPPFYEYPPGTVCMVAGWGNTEQGGTMANILQKVELPLVSDEGILEKE